ncbi:hypothetical protein [Micromonospora sp. NPDC004704]
MDTRTATSGTVLTCREMSGAASTPTPAPIAQPRSSPNTNPNPAITPYMIANPSSVATDRR